MLEARLSDPETHPRVGLSHDMSHTRFSPAAALLSTIGLFSPLQAITTISTWSSGGDAVIASSIPPAPANPGHTSTYVGTGTVNNTVAATLYMRATVLSTNVQVLFANNNATGTFDIVLRDTPTVSLGDRAATIRYDFFSDANLTVPLVIDEMFVLSDDIDLNSSRREGLSAESGLTFVALETPSNIQRTGPGGLVFLGGADQAEGELSGAVGFSAQNTSSFTINYFADNVGAVSNARFYHRTGSLQPFSNPTIIPVPEPSAVALGGFAVLVLVLRRRHQ